MADYSLKEFKDDTIAGLGQGMGLAGGVIGAIRASVDKTRQDIARSKIVEENPESLQLKDANMPATSIKPIDLGGAQIEVPQEYQEMDNLALSNPVEFIARYNSPREWLMEQDEAERIKTFSTGADLEVGFTDKVGFGLGQVAIGLEQTPAQLAQLEYGLLKGIKQLTFPNSTDTAVDRIYNDLALLNAENADKREQVLQAYTGDSDIVKWTSAIGELGLALATAGIGGGVGAARGVAGAAKTATTTAKGVAKSSSVLRRAESIARAGGARTGQRIATIGYTFPQEAGSTAVDKVRSYIAQTGDTELKNYNPLGDTMTSIAVGTINAAIETAFGVERYIPEFWGTGTNFNRVARRLLESAIGEGSEEFVQSVVTDLGDILNGYRDNIDWQNALNGALIGGVLGGSAGVGMYHLNRIRMAKQIANDYDMPFKKATQVVDDILGTGIERTNNELSAQAELVNQKGNAWDKMVTGVKTAMGSVGFADENARTAQANIFAKTNAAIAVREAQKAGLSTDEFLDVAEFAMMNNGQNLNMVFIKPLGSIADIDARIKSLDETIKREQELKKTGAGVNKIITDAKMQKAILQKAKAIKQFNDKQYQEQIKAQTTTEVANEIETATKDVDIVKNMPTQADFDTKMDNNLTTAQKTKRYGNAVLKRILPGKSEFDAVMVDPMYANAKQAIVAVADRINAFMTKHRTYNLKTDLANALKQMQTVNQANFIDSVSTPALDGVDVIAENAFLYHFLFSDVNTIQTFLESYITRAEASINKESKAPLSKKDLVGQAFKATDEAMVAQSNITGAPYESIYNQNGSYASKNVLAVMVSYQNQFLTEIQTAKTIEYTDQEVLGIFAKAKLNNEIELSNWENVRWSSLLSAGDTYQKGKRHKPATEADKAKFARKMLDKYMPGWNQVSEPQQLPLFQKQFDLDVINLTETFNGIKSTNPEQVAIEVEQQLNDLIGIALDTKTEPFKIQLTEDNKGHVKTTNLKLNEKQLNKHNTALLNLKQIANNATKIEKDGTVETSHNTRKSTLEHKANVIQYIYFNSPIQIKNNLYVVELHTEQVKGQNPNILDLYHVRVKYQGNAQTSTLSPDSTDIISDKTQEVKKNYNPRLMIPKVRGGWTKEKIKAYLKAHPSLSGQITAKKLIREFGSVEELKSHMFWHGARTSVLKGLKPSILFSEEEAGTRGSGGYGERYWAISITKSKRVAGTFATAMEGKGVIHPVLLVKGANVIEMPELTDSADLDEHIVDLYERGVDAVWIGDKDAGEQELAVINPRAIVNLGQTEYYKGYKLGSAENPINIKSDVDIQAMFDFAKSGAEGVGNVLWQGNKANGFYDRELGVIVLGRNMNEMTLPHEMQHYWLDTIFSVYKRAKAGEINPREEWMQETRDLFGMLGIDENQAEVNEVQHEKFARMSEAYLTGLGVDPSQNQTFKEYLSWVPEKYKSIMNLGYLDENRRVQLPYLDQAAIEFFNKWYDNLALPSLPSSPEAQRFVNPTDAKGEIIPSTIKEMNDRNKEFAQDAEEQIRTDERLYNTLDANMDADIKVEADGQREVIKSRSNFLKESENQQRRWFERKSRDTEAKLAQEYIEKNPEHAKEVIYGDPELVPNDTGVDRATLINAYMALNKITPNSDDWARLQTNIAINQSLAGTQLALSNNTSYRTYLDALREIESARELKVATNYAGTKSGALEKFNKDIKQFVDNELPNVLATAPNSEAREVALKALFEKARTKFSGNVTGPFLNQMDFEYAKAQKGASAAFTRWAVNQIKKDAGAKLNPKEQAELLNISAKAQQAMIDIDNRDIGKAVAGAQEIRKWQVEKDKLTGVKPQRFSLFGDWAPRAMLASFNTLVVSNIPSTAMNTLVVRGLESGIFGKNNVSKSLTDSEIKRIKAIYGATAMNLAQMEKPTSPSLLHGEKYSTSGQKWYDPFTILGKEDNWFRVPTFVNVLARIASEDAKATNRTADEVFEEYCRLENQSDSAKLARKQALAVSNMAVFTQDGSVAKMLNGIRDWINQGSRAIFGLDPKGGFGLGTLLSPFLKTGANIAEMGIRGSIAPITTITALVQSWRSGTKIDPIKKLALGMDWTYFLMSSLAVALLAAFEDDEFYVPPYEMGKPYDPDTPYDSIKIGGVWIDLDFFGPFAIPIRTGCLLVQQWKTDKSDAIYKGYGQTLKYAAMDTPLLESVFNNQMGYATKKTGDWATGYAYTQVNKLVPSQIKPLSRAITRETGYAPDVEVGWPVLSKKFHRNYGFDGAKPTTQDWVDVLSTKFTLDQKE